MPADFQAPLPPWPGVFGQWADFIPVLDSLELFYDDAEDSWHLHVAGDNAVAL